MHKSNEWPGSFLVFLFVVLTQITEPSDGEPGVQNHKISKNKNTVVKKNLNIKVYFQFQSRKTLIVQICQRRGRRRTACIYVVQMLYFCGLWFYAEPSCFFFVFWS